MKKEMLIISLFVLVFLGFGITIALTSIHSAKNHKMLRLPRIPSAPKLILPYPGTPPGDPNDIVVIRRFLQQMDSLRQDSAGCKLYDSICLFRPGLLDSARKAEKFYNLLNTLK